MPKQLDVSAVGQGCDLTCDDRKVASVLALLGREKAIIWEGRARPARAGS